MVFPRVRRLPAILFVSSLLISTSEGSDGRDGIVPPHIQEMQDRIGKYDNSTISACKTKCADKMQAEVDEKTAYIPHCSWIVYPKPGEEYNYTESTLNQANCGCTDRKQLAQSFECLVKECSTNSKDLTTSLEGLYASCKLYGDIALPEPKAFFNELCLLDDIPEDSIPSDVAFVKELWPEYTFANEWPNRTTMVSDDPGLEKLREHFANNKANWTCVPKDLSENNGNGALGRKELMGMGVMVAIVTSFAVLL